jgi:hypothetical protein
MVTLRELTSVVARECVATPEVVRGTTRTISMQYESPREISEKIGKIAMAKIKV